MYELEQGGVNVVWQDPQDRIAIRHAIQQDMIAIIALDMNPNGKAPTGDATSSSYGTNTGGGQSAHSSGTPHLINLLDNEGEGGTVHWVEPHHRELAIEARLAAFRQAARNDCSNINEMECDDWPELSQELGNIMDMESDDCPELSQERYPPQTNVNQQEVLSMPSGTVAVLGDATPSLAALGTDADAFFQEQTPVTLPTVRKFEPCKNLNDFAFDARRLRGSPQ